MLKQLHVNSMFGRVHQRPDRHSLRQKGEAKCDDFVAIIIIKEAITFGDFIRRENYPNKNPGLLLSAEGHSTQAESTKEPTGLFGLSRRRRAGLCSLAAISQVERERERRKVARATSSPLM